MASLSAAAPMVMTPAVERMSLDSVRMRASTGKAVMDMATPTCVCVCGGGWVRSGRGLLCVRSGGWWNGMGGWRDGSGVCCSSIGGWGCMYGHEGKTRGRTTMTHEDEEGAVVRVLVAGLRDEQLVEEQRRDQGAEAEGERDPDDGDGDGLAPVPLEDLGVQLHADEEEVEHQPVWRGGVYEILLLHTPDSSKQQPPRPPPPTTPCIYV